MILPCVLAVLLHVASALSPPFCRELECPDYTIYRRNETKDYVIREYKETRWAVTQTIADDYVNASTQSYDRLLGYFNGQNKEGFTMNLTLPVLERYELPPITSPGHVVYTVEKHMLLPADLQEAPEPNDTGIYFITLPEMKIYVRQFEGYVTPGLVLHHAFLLSQDIGNFTFYGDDYFMAAEYDRPTSRERTYNEIWFFKDN